MTDVLEKPKVKRRITPKKQRKLIESAIDRLVDLLDEMDGDPDIEPSLGSVSCLGRFGYHRGYARDLYGWDQTRWAAGPGDDLEEQCEDEGAQCEDEGAEHDGREEEAQSWPNPMAENRVGEAR